MEFKTTSKMAERMAAAVFIPICRLRETNTFGLAFLSPKLTLSSAPSPVTYTNMRDKDISIKLKDTDQ